MKFSPPAAATPLDELRFECAIRTRFLSLVWNGLNITANRFFGEEFLIELTQAALLGEQSERFLEAIRKLGLEDEPPALKAAKYHYFSNEIGGIASQIIIESDRKAWLRHPSPQASWPGLSFLALPSRSRRVGFTTWHPRDGELMGSPELRWVVTKVRTEGQPYEEGYFEEMDRPLHPSEVLAFEHAEHTPEFIPELAPTLDPTQWPEARRLKARRNYIRDYANQSLASIDRLLGPVEARRVLETCLQGLAHQYTHEFMKELGLTAASLDELTHALSAFLWLAGIPHEISATGDNVRQLTLDEADGDAFSRSYPAAAHVWLDLIVRILNGHMSLDRIPSPGRAEVWELIDAGRWIR